MTARPSALRLLRLLMLAACSLVSLSLFAATPPEGPVALLPLVSWEHPNEAVGGAAELILVGGSDIQSWSAAVETALSDPVARKVRIWQATYAAISGLLAAQGATVVDADRVRGALDQSALNYWEADARTPEAMQGLAEALEAEQVVLVELLCRRFTIGGVGGFMSANYPVEGDVRMEVFGRDGRSEYVAVASGTSKEETPAWIKAFCKAAGPWVTGGGALTAPATSELPGSGPIGCFVWPAGWAGSTPPPVGLQQGDKVAVVTYAPAAQCRGYAQQLATRISAMATKLGLQPVAASIEPVASGRNTAPLPTDARTSARLLEVAEGLNAQAVVYCEVYSLHKEAGQWSQFATGAGHVLATDGTARWDMPVLEDKQRANAISLVSRLGGGVESTGLAIQIMGQAVAVK